MEVINWLLWVLLGLIAGWAVIFGAVEYTAYRQRHREWWRVWARELEANHKRLKRKGAK